MQQEQTAPTLTEERDASPSRFAPDLLHTSIILRLLLALLLGILFFGELPPALLGSHSSGLFSYTVVTYFGLVLLSGLLLRLGFASTENLTYFTLFIDIIAFTLLMHASGGLKSGLGMLIAISIAAGSLLIRGRTALLFAALATLAILTEQVYAHLNNSFATTAYAHAGLLGGSYFTIAILAVVLSKRLTESEQLASQRELDLANLAQLNEYVIQHMQTGVIMIDEQGRIRLKNEAAWSLLGMNALPEEQALALACPPLWQQLTAWKNAPDDERWGFRAAEGGRDLQANFVRLGRKGLCGTLIFLEDSALVTERAQQMKLASLGRLTASIAHEIRNPLGAISHAGQLLDESPQLASGDHRLTEIIRNNAQRVNGIIENVLQLSRRQRGQPTELALLPWLEALATEARQHHRLPPEALTLEIQPADTRIRIDPSQLRQVLDNLIDNAVYHFKGDRQGLRLHIQGGTSPESGGPFLEISDNGPGIDEETRRHIFEPFFTTGHTGSGLGLYIARELCECNRARLEYVPTLETGCRFRISFPGLRSKVFNP
jgi:two-component system sensor histidine kinase PilS (NtrC family)